MTLHSTASRNGICKTNLKYLDTKTNPPIFVPNGYTIALNKVNIGKVKGVLLSH